MAFADPQTINAISCPRTSSGVNTGAFTSADGNSKFTVSHAYGKRTRRTARYDFSKIAADPLVSAQNIKYSMSAYVVVDTPITGFTVAEATTVCAALFTLLTASTNAKLIQLLGGEN